MDFSLADGAAPAECLGFTGVDYPMASNAAAAECLELAGVDYPMASGEKSDRRRRQPRLGTTLESFFAHMDQRLLCLLDSSLACLETCDG